jgi:hypothetical protein
MLPSTVEIAGYWARVYSIKHSDNTGIYALDYYLTMFVTEDSYS